MPGSVIVSTARTPIGKLSGALASFSAMDLGGIAIRAALERAGVEPDQIDHKDQGEGQQNAERLWHQEHGVGDQESGAGGQELACEGNEQHHRADGAKQAETNHCGAGKRDRHW